MCVQALVGPHILHAGRTAGERTHAPFGAECVHGRHTPTPAESGREAGRVGESGLCHSLFGRDDRRRVRALFAFSQLFVR